MTRRIPIVATLVVLLAVAAMIRLGFWQLDRRQEKAALLARYTANLGAAPVPIQSLWPIGEDRLFRRVTATCAHVVRWQVEAGRNRAGQTGWRHIAWCGTGAEGPGLAVDTGISQDAASPRWAGGSVSGRLSAVPTDRPLIARLFSKDPALTPMVVSETAPPGLQPSAPPDPSAVPNNHLSYAVQWFLFAGIALIIYVVALMRRGRSVAHEAPPR